jgi:hypothetical protein
MFSTIILASAVSGGLHNPCLDATQPYAKMPFCNPTLDIDVRVKDMLSRMDLKTEK